MICNAPRHSDYPVYVSYTHSPRSPSPLQSVSRSGQPTPGHHPFPTLRMTFVLTKEKFRQALALAKERPLTKVQGAEQSRQAPYLVRGVFD